MIATIRVEWRKTLPTQSVTLVLVLIEDRDIMEQKEIINTLITRLLSLPWPFPERQANGATL